MNAIFAGPAQPLTQDGLNRAVALLNLTPVHIWTVLGVETRGECGFLTDGRPKILYERHIFSRRTHGRYDAAAPDISQPEWGGYGREGAHQYERLARAIALSRTAALESASWGIGQVMGFNAQLVGCDSVEELVAQAMQGEDQQLMHFARYISARRLDEPLRSEDWPAFARGFNGAGFARNRYDIRLRQQHAKWSAGELPDLDVRARQILLARAGYDPGPIDGIDGRRTQDAWRAYSSALAA